MTNDALLAVTFFDCVKDTRPRENGLLGAQAVRLLTQHTRRTEKDGPCWSPTAYQPGTTRGKENVVNLSCLVLDFDNGTLPTEVASPWGKWKYVLHSTFSHTPDHPKFRVIFPLAEPVPAADWPSVYRRLAAALGSGHTDPACKDCSRVYYLPSAKPGAAVLATHHEGALLDPAAFSEPRAETPRPAPSPPPGRARKGAAKYTLAALEGELARLAAAPPGTRNVQLNRAAFALGQLVAGAALDRGGVEAALMETARSTGLGEAEIRTTIASGLDAGEKEPRHVPGEDTPPAIKGTKGNLHLTDLGNAERLVARHGGDLGYCHPWGRWLVWNGRRWAIDDTAEVERRAKETVRGIYAEAAEAMGEDGRKKRASWAMRSESRHRLDAMIALAQSEPHIPVLPDALDANRWLLTVGNGTLDLRTCKLRPHDRDDMITHAVEVDYDPTAQAPLWRSFLTRVMGGNEDLIAFLQRAVGYSLTGDTSERALFFLHGRGSNGKSTFLETIRTMAGDYGLRTPTETLLAKRDGTIPNDVARLRGARLVTAAEADEGKRLAEALVKDISGGDTISARFLRAEWFDFRPECKIWLAANHKPTVRGTDKAIWDRIRLIPFTVTIPEEEQDHRLLEKLKAERTGILAWAVKGCLAWQRNGLGVPSEVKEATASYRDEMDVLGGFIADCCVLAPTVRGTAKALYQRYVDWCQVNGERPISQRAFGLRLVERGVEQGRGTGGVRLWFGMGIRDASDA